MKRVVACARCIGVYWAAQSAERPDAPDPERALRHCSLRATRPTSVATLCMARLDIRLDVHLAQHVDRHCEYVISMPWNAAAAVPSLPRTGAVPTGRHNSMDSPSPSITTSALTPPWAPARHPRQAKNPLGVEAGFLLASRSLALELKLYAEDGVVDQPVEPHVGIRWDESVRRREVIHNWG